MIRALFAPLTPAEELARERAQVARQKPHLAFAPASPPIEIRPMRDPFGWVSIAELLPVEESQ